MESGNPALPTQASTKAITYNDYPDVLTVREVQSYLRLGRNATYDALQSGAIRSVRIGQKFLIPKAALREFLDLGANEPGAGIPVKGNA